MTTTRTHRTSYDKAIDWLLEGDPSVVWQVQRDLLDRAPRTWQATRRKVARQGWGARLLKERDEAGTWSGVLYDPRWTSTFYTLRLLSQLGIAPNHKEAKQSCQLLIDEGVTETGGVSLWKSDSTDTCVTSMLVQLAYYFGLGEDRGIKRAVRWLLKEQMPDGGWNCKHRRGATHSSFHTTLSTLEAFSSLSRKRTAPRPTAVQRASRSAEEFFYQHQLYRSHRTGNIARSSFSQFSFPTRWYFDVLRGLGYFEQQDTAWDDRLSDPVALVRRRQRTDGRWNSQNYHNGKTFFRLEPGRGPSRMVTLRALRVLRWANRVQEVS
ncbi:MAG: hypothetical protein GY811_14315 [Myxococcales bacterium]|nr:hypothetical protein [Myxococcales bacterium]